MSANTRLRIGIDLGGTKIAGVVLGANDESYAEDRQPTPRNDYAATVTAIAEMVARLEADANAGGASGPATVGIGIPGSCAPATGLIQNANSTWLNGRTFKSDLETALQRPVRMANDANCFALSEAVDGSAVGVPSVFGVIIGTGCGGGVVINGSLVDGPLGISGEWGHMPLPSPRSDELPGPRCWCGRFGCMETWVSGPAVAVDHERFAGDQLTSEGIAQLAESGNAQAQATLERLADRLARGLATVTNILDPDVIVLGGGLSSITPLYKMIPERMAQHVFADHVAIDIRPPKWGPASGVRGAARLWG